MANRYILLSGAKKNFGDFLIVDRSKKRLKEERPDREIIEFNGWEPVDDHIDLINDSKAVIIAGGPGYQPHTYPKVYPLAKNIDLIKVPIIPMALGWYGFPGDDYTFNDYKFTPMTKSLLRRIHDTCQFSSCRDYVTQKLLNVNGYNNVLMTGCSTWYDFAYVAKAFQPPVKIKKIIFSDPQNKLYHHQAIDLLRKLRAKYPRDVEIVCHFHRGVSEDHFTTPEYATRIKNFIDVCKEINVEYVDLSYGLTKAQHYEDCDLHIGYRLHGHLYTLSKRKPSFLMNEDGRGQGTQEALGLKSIYGYERHPIDRWFLDRGVGSYSQFQKILDRLQIGLLADLQTPDVILSYLEDQAKSRFQDFHEAFKNIDRHYEVMRKFLQSLP